ncbi:hypothetical protein QMA69_30575, partial [Burkholderia pseudomallei]|nr:hypothetical protein [Burkholderia pseudomallei]MEB5507648.1 hypothetical protein [Burkholderia pseudomallei]MEB5514322.1 hypothetical protein [Burkholderia pseudomallei]
MFPSPGHLSQESLSCSQTTSSRKPPKRPPREAVAPTAIAPRARTLDDYLKLVLNARVYDVARETALERARNLSARLGNAVYLKREDNQPV